MEADSTISSNLRSWNSSETLSNVDDGDFVCQTCKQHELHSNEVRRCKIRAEENQCSIFFVKSKVFLLCQICYEMFHMHCIINGDITLELFQDFIQNSFTCHNCQQPENQQ